MLVSTVTRDTTNAQLEPTSPVPTTAIVLHLTYKKNENHVLGGISNMDEVEKFFQKKIAV